MTTPPFTAEQLDWLNANLPSGPAKRVLGDITPTSDAQQVGAYAVLSAEQQKAVDDKIAADKATADYAAALAALASAATQVSSATEQIVASAPAGVDTKPLEDAVAVIQQTVDTTG